MEAIARRSLDGIRDELEVTLQEPIHADSKVCRRETSEHVGSLRADYFRAERLFCPCSIIQYILRTGTEHASCLFPTRKLHNEDCQV